MKDPGHLDRLFAAALERPAEERDAFVEEASGGDDGLRAELRHLLRAYQASDGFLDDPAPWLAGLTGPHGVPLAASGPAVWPGRRFSHYEVLEPIGSGGMGAVFKARDTKLERPVTLKFLHPHLLSTPHATERFVQEAKAASALDHPSICTIYEIDETLDGHLFIAMAYYAGETLKDRLGRGPLPFEQAIDIARAIAAGLMRAHEAGIVHRDLKPANVMLTDHGEVKILDFGIAKLQGSDNITASGTRLGTIAYMSPEHVRSDPVDHRTDVWALGVVAAEMLGGEHPFPGDSDAAVLHAIVHREPSLPAGLPPDVKRVLHRALAKDPGDRYGSMAQFGDALDALSRGDTPATRPSRRLGRRGRGAAALGLGVAAVALWALVRSGEKPAPVDDPVPRLAVLPFENVGAADDEYFADGITDEVVARLARIGGLTVLGRQSAMRFRDTDLSPQRIGEELGVDYLLNATVRWEKEGNRPARVRVGPQLVRTSDGTQLWSDVFQDDFTGVFAVQSALAERVADALGVTLLEPERRAIARRPTESLEAYDHYLRGNHFLLRRDPESTLRGIDEYRSAARIDPTFAGAQARVAYAFGLFADHGWIHPTLSADSLLAEGFAAADHALELDPRSADAWMARGYLLVFRNPDTYAGVADAFEQAIAYDPNNAEAHLQYASMIGRLGFTDRVEELFDRALALEPLEAIALTNLAFFHLIDRRYDQALVYADSAVRVNPTLFHTLEHRAQIRSHAGLHTLARADADAALRGTRGALGREALALVAARAGRDDEARDLVRSAVAAYDSAHNEGRMWLLGALVALGDTARVFELLTRERDRLGLVYLRHLMRLPEFDPVRDHPRFVGLAGTERDAGPPLGLSVATPRRPVLGFRERRSARRRVLRVGCSTGFSSPG